MLSESIKQRRSPIWGEKRLPNCLRLQFSHDTKKKRGGGGTNSKAWQVKKKKKKKKKLETKASYNHHLSSFPVRSSFEVSRLKWHHHASWHKVIFHLLSEKIFYSICLALTCYIYWSSLFSCRCRPLGWSLEGRALMSQWHSGARTMQGLNGFHAEMCLCVTATLLTASHTDKYAIATIKICPITRKIFPGTS